jgi:hypothetical protein
MVADKAEIKPLTEILGYSVLDSQRLEYSIAFMMLLLNNELNLSDKEQDDKIDNYMESLSKKTLGNLIRELKKISNVSNEFEERLSEALDARNYLIHKFFNDQNEKLLTSIGREEALKTLKSKRKILFDCYEFLDPFIQTLMQLKGMNPKVIMEDVANKFEGKTKPNKS